MEKNDFIKIKKKKYLATRIINICFFLNSPWYDGNHAFKILFKKQTSNNWKILQTFKPEKKFEKKYFFEKNLPNKHLRWYCFRNKCWFYKTRFEFSQLITYLSYIIFPLVTTTLW